MRFSVFTHVVHKKKTQKVFAYAPYIREMNLWISKASEVRIIGPLEDLEPDSIDSPYKHSNLNLVEVPSLYFKSFLGVIRSLVMMIPAIITIFREMRAADHIHIRCPGNIGLLACIIQIFFPGKNKTVKYAGNWDPNSSQPWTYNLQRKILNSPFFSRNIKVLVYGEWNYSSRNIVPFFTASYSNKEIKSFSKDFSPPYKCVFTGTLAEGKRPLLAVKVIQELINRGFNISLDVYGQGDKSSDIIEYINEYGIQDKIKLYGNQKPDVIKKALRNAHFVILLSRSEGWPKTLAEGMFYGCIPISTNISCVDWMLGKGERGILVEPTVDKAALEIETYLHSLQKLNVMSKKGQEWSQKYTLEVFDKEIKKLI